MVGNSLVLKVFGFQSFSLGSENNSVWKGRKYRHLVRNVYVFVVGYLSYIWFS